MAFTRQRTTEAQGQHQTPKVDTLIYPDLSRWLATFLNPSAVNFYTVHGGHQKPANSESTFLVSPLTRECDARMRSSLPAMQAGTGTWDGPAPRGARHAQVGAACGHSPFGSPTVLVSLVQWLTDWIVASLSGRGSCDNTGSSRCLRTALCEAIKWRKDASHRDGNRCDQVARVCQVS